MDWRDRFKRRTLVYGTGSVAAVLLVMGILVLAALLSDRYNFRWDATLEQTQSLSAITKALLAEVNKPLNLTAFYPEGFGERQTAKELLQRYTYQNRQVSYSLVDPEREPLKAQEAGFRYPGNVSLEYEGRRQLADRTDEEAITNALRRLLKPERKKVYFLSGHGERDLNDAQRGGFQVARQALANEGFEVQDLNLLAQAAVPQDAAVVVAASPKKALLPNEITALKGYLGRGGRLLVMLEPFQDGGLKELLAGYGVELDDGMILDMNQVSQALGASAVMSLVLQYGPHPITEKFKNIVTLYPMARPLTLKREVKGLKLLPLATTLASSWEKLGKEWMKSGKGDFDDKKDRKGPFTLAALVEIEGQPKKVERGQEQAPADKKPEEQKSYLVVFGNVDFAANGYFNFFGNGDLFLNTVNFLASEEKQITLRQDKKAQPLTLSQRQAWTLLLTSLVVIPLVMLGAGIWAYRTRRARR